MNPLLPFLMAGDPSLEALPALLAEARALGLGTLEVGLPHSDPIADGPVLQAAAHRAIQAGATSLRVLEALAGIQDSPDLVLFTYLNPLLQLGTEQLIRLLRPTPVRALLIVDLPDGEEPAFVEGLAEAGYPLVPLLAPTTTPDRAARLLEARPDPGPERPFAQRFAYLVARLGVTGGGASFDPGPLVARIQTIRTLTERPLAVGFGLSEPAAMQALRDLGVTPVVGSALVAELAAGLPLRQALAERMLQTSGSST